ncbi:probable cyclin-dependent serine/threonine-protein kinase DDB_G0292550 [Chenopodium quinoa]|uniref:probable cyclin-dependent serine/threonine-protein kinase DDB_G0292550 n=1 Tax=Chenopodium quinoa TaxID=63459 RepID=UPI000B775F93|nr:probable cyclin-dependent serine/threonine-protein kinase DDB_G0292550 [Chenopodium quinoa]
MDSSKPSNRISDIVRLKQKLKKWRIQAHEAKVNGGNTDDNDGSNNSSNNAKKGSLNRSNSKGNTFIKRRTLSFTDLAANNGMSSKGFLPLDDTKANISNSGSNSSSSSSTKKGSLTRSNSIKGINFLKRTLSFTDLSANNGVPSNNAVPKGFLAVQVGEEMKRFVIPTKYLSHQAFSVLLKEAEEEFGYQKEGVLRIPCEVEVFENILKAVEEKNSSQAKQGLKFSRNDGIVCGSSDSQSLSQAQHPPTPMCR